MFNKTLILFAFLFVIVLSSISASTAPLCKELFDVVKPRKTYLITGDINIYQPLPTEFVSYLKERIVKSPLQKKINDWNQGEGHTIRFEIDVFGDMKGYGLGERIQAKFLLSFLRIAFPKAKIIGNTDEVEFSKDTRHKPLMVLDRTELSMDQPEIVDMFRLQLANPGGILKNINGLRKEFHLSESDKAVSLYIQNKQSSLVDKNDAFSIEKTLTKVASSRPDLNIFF